MREMKDGQQAMKKRRKGKILIFAAMLVIISAIIFVARIFPKPTLYHIGDTATISAKNDIETGKRFKFIAGVIPEGTMEITLNDVEIYEDFQSAGIEEKDISTSAAEDFNMDFSQAGKKILVANFTLHNMDAAFGPDDATKNDFSASIFTLSNKKSFSGLSVLGGSWSAGSEIKDDVRYVYFSAHPADDQDGNTKYNHFTLPAGESITFKLGFIVSEESIASKNKLVIKIGSRPSNKYGFALDLNQ